MSEIAQTHRGGQPPAHEPLTSWEGWRRFVDTPDEPPTAMPAARRAEMTDEERSRYADARLGYHSRLAIVATPIVQQVTLAGRRLIVLNRHQISARRGLIVTGDAGTGKTTAITQLGKSHELAQRLRQPRSGPRLAVVYVTVPPAATPRMLAVEFARFLGLPVSPRSNITDITNTVCGVLGDCGCDLVLVDEIHNLNLATRAGAEVSDQLKYFSERLPATFVYAGIDVERAGLFAGTRGRQIAGRFAAIATHPFGYGTSSQRQAWRALIATFEHSLQLHRHPTRSPAQPGRLPAQANRRDDWQSVPPAPRCRRRCDHHRRREDHQSQPGQRPTRPGCRTPPGHGGGAEQATAAQTDRRRLMTTPARRLPVAVPLVRAETISSYLSRIARANHLHPLDLQTYLSRDKRRITRPDPDLLALLTGHSPDLLTSLIVGLDRPRGVRTAPVGTLACRRCMARRGIVHNVRRVTPDLLLCQRHRRWTGDSDVPVTQQYDLGPVHDVVSAHRRHQHLLRRHGGSFRAFFEDAKHIHHRWTERGDWPGPRTRRLSAYYDLHRWRIQHHPIMMMVNYPETVALAGLLASDQWSALAVSPDPADGKRFDIEVGTRLRIPYQWYTAHDPLGRWRQAEAQKRRLTKLLNYNGPSA